MVDVGKSLRRLTVRVDKTLLNRVFQTIVRRFAFQTIVKRFDGRGVSIIRCHFDREDIRRGTPDLRRNLRFPLWIVLSTPKVFWNPLIRPVPIATLRMNHAIGSMGHIP